MNFSIERKSDNVMKVDDVVIIYESHDSLTHLYLVAGHVLNNKFGSFYHDDFIGQKFGSKISSRTSNGWIYALEPSPELWTVSLNTRTQIVDELDCSVVTFFLDLYPGCRVVESGTGSGNMSMSLVRAVWPTGRVHSFEYNQFRADEATAEFQRLVMLK
jgi:tRNA (adenine57-N1/adenine58-N1)-methyltransferase